MSRRHRQKAWEQYIIKKQSGYTDPLEPFDNIRFTENKKSNIKRINASQEILTDSSGCGGNCKCIFKKKKNLTVNDEPINPCWNDDPLGDIPGILPNSRSSNELCFEIEQLSGNKRKCECQEAAGKITPPENPDPLRQNKIIASCEECPEIIQNEGGNDSDPAKVQYCKCLEQLMRRLKQTPSKEDVDCCFKRLENSDWFYPCCCPHPEFPWNGVDPVWDADKWMQYKCQYGIRLCKCKEDECKMNCAINSKLNECLVRAFNNCIEGINMPHDIPLVCTKERREYHKCQQKCKQRKTQCNKNVAACKDVKGGGFDTPSLE